MRPFLMIFTGQFASMLGTGLTSFALGVYVYEKTGSATAYATIKLFIALPKILLAPLAGPIVDRFNRRHVMIATDGFAACSSLLLLYLMQQGEVEVWHVYLVTAIAGVAAPFQEPAYTAGITQLVPKEQLMRASGMVRSATGFQSIFAPLMAGWLLGIVHLDGLVWIDLATFLFALGTLMMVRIPDLPPRAGARAGIWAEAKEGTLYLWERKPLMGLLVLFFGFNFFSATLLALHTPLILNLGDARMLGVLLSIFGASFLLGGIALATYRGPKPLIGGVFAGSLGCALSMIIAGSVQGFALQAVACAIFGFSMPVVIGCTQVIWQKKIPNHLQGRVHSTRLMIALASMPLAFLLCGPMVDQVFQPLMDGSGALAELLRPIFGTGKGSGIGLTLAVMGCLNLAFISAAWLVPTLRNVETLIPDAH